MFSRTKIFRRDNIYIYIYVHAIIYINNGSFDSFGISCFSEQKRESCDLPEFFTLIAVDVAEADIFGSASEQRHTRESREDTANWQRICGALPQAYLLTGSD